jgi:serine/threonine protein kinase
MFESHSHFITKLHFSFRDEHYYYMGIEWAEEGDLFSLINEDTRRVRLFREMGEKALRFILGCVVLGLESLHSKNIAYWDLKPENLLVFADGYIKLTDFGLAQHIHASEHAHKKIKAGTPAYFAPEMALGRECGKEADLWTLGVLAYELASYQLPFDDLVKIKNPNEMRKMINESEGKRRWGHH